MEEQAICLLLKEQSDTLHAELDVQIVALTADLQAAKIVRHCRGPYDWRFLNFLPVTWICAIHGYFDLLDTPNEQQLKVVGFNLEVDAPEWFRWMSRNKLITSWESFLDSVRNRFGP
ncbi:hypothetical protein Tco_0197953, partial [Tanacetum coccineum]